MLGAKGRDYSSENLSCKLHCFRGREFTGTFQFAHKREPTSTITFQLKNDCEPEFTITFQLKNDREPEFTETFQLKSICEQEFTITLQLATFLKTGVFNFVATCNVIRDGSARSVAACIVICAGSARSVSVCRVICAGSARAVAVCRVVCAGSARCVAVCNVICAGSAKCVATCSISYPTVSDCKKNAFFGGKLLRVSKIFLPLHPQYGTSSVGRALVSKTRCREFEPLVPCRRDLSAERGGFFVPFFLKINGLAYFPTQELIFFVLNKIMLQKTLYNFAIV